MDKVDTAANAQILTDLTQSTVYLMGACFVLGSLFTLFLLLVLDFVRRHKVPPQE